MSIETQGDRDWIRLGLLAVLGLAVIAAGVCWLCAVVPVTTYELERVAEGPYAPGHFGKAWFPERRTPTGEEVTNRILVCLAGMLICAVVGVFFLERWYASRPAPDYICLAEWNLHGLDSSVSAARDLPVVKS